jgi:hypothetical protein
VTAYGNDGRVQVRAWGSDDREVTYRIAAEHVPSPPPPSDLDWAGLTPGDSIEVKYIQDGAGVNGWVVFAVGADYVQLNDWGAYKSADAALAVVLGDPQ